MVVQLQEDVNYAVENVDLVLFGQIYVYHVLMDIGEMIMTNVLIYAVTINIYHQKGANLAMGLV